MVKKEAAVQKKEKTVSNVKEGIKVDKVLIENFVSLQKVMTNLAVKFDNLSSQISKLLELFEISAKTLAEKGDVRESGTDKELAEKIDNLLEQNKIFAKGLALLHEKSSQEPQYKMPPQTMRPMQQMPPQRIPYDFSRNPRIGK